MIKVIQDNNENIFAKIIRASYQSKDTEFFTKDTDEIQLGVITYPKNHKTGAHYHNHIQSQTTQVDEILMVQQGSARVDFYDNQGAYIKSSEIFEGDIIIIYKGAHNMLFLEDTKVFKIKPGAYNSQEDKTRIIGTNNLELIIEN